MIQSTIHRDDHGDPVFTLTVTGIHDLYRVAEHLAFAQSDVKPHGRRAFRFLAQLMGVERFEAFDRDMTGGRIAAARLHEGRILR